jgi:NAD(P)-dependent dehydrogenase (short-subunit alcohol dehydrogenase family)
MHTNIRRANRQGGVSPDEEVSVFGTDTPFKRAAQPYELAGAYVYLASPDSSYVTGTCIHVNGGDMVTS